jgi:predicted dehydrogenase
MSKHKVLLVGCGGMGSGWLKYILQRNDCQVLGLCDIIPEKAQKMKEDHKLDPNPTNTWSPRL